MKIQHSIALYGVSLALLFGASLLSLPPHIGGLSASDVKATNGQYLAKATPSNDGKLALASN